MVKTDIHIGKIILQELDKQQRSIAWLAEKIGCHRSHLPRMLKKTSVDSEILCRISVELAKDFHNIYSQKFQKEVCCKNATE